MLNLIIVHLFGLMTPGPDFFYVSRMAASNSRRNTVCGILGITFGIAFLGDAFYVGIGGVIRYYSRITWRDYVARR